MTKNTETVDNFSIITIYFYIEIDGTVSNDEGRKMMEELGRICDQLKIVGSFAPHAQI